MSTEANNEEQSELDNEAVDSTEQPENVTEEPSVETDGEVECSQGESELTDALEKVAALEEQILRERAETQNVRKRVQRDVENARKFALEKFVGELLPVIDNLERAKDASGDVNAVKEGIELTLKGFLDVMAKFQVEPIDPLGEPFDANFHQAMTMVPNPEMEPNTVMDVMQKGYTLNGRLVRPAMVVVSKAAE